MTSSISPTNFYRFLFSTVASAAVNVLLPKEGADLNTISIITAIFLFAISKANLPSSNSLSSSLNTAIVISTGGIWTGALLVNSVKAIANEILET